MPFIGKQSSANSKIKKYSYTATADQTNFAVVSGSGDEIQVFFNGVKLKETDDYTYSTSQVTLGSPASSGDIVDIHVFSSFLIADAVSSSTGGPFGTGNNEYSLPTIRATENDQVLQMTNITNGTVEWKATVVDPSITAVTGQLNATEATGEGGGGTLVITGADLGTNILQVTDVSICNSSGGSPVPATQKSITSSNTEITATWTGTEVGYSSFSGVYYVKLTKSGKTSNIFNSTKQISADPTISSVTGVNGDLFSGSVSSSNLGTYGGTIAGGGEDSNTKLLLNFDRGGGTDIEDSSNTGGDGHKVTATNAVIKASPFGDGKSAISFLGSDDHLEIDHSTDFNFGAGSSGSSANDFTIEFWVYRNTNNSYQALIGKGDDAGSNSYLTAWFLVSDNSAATNSLKLERNGSTVVGGIWRYETKRWYHIALVRSEDVFTIYVDGKTFASATSTVDLDYSGHLYVGAGANAGPHELNLDGYMDEIRIVKGSAVYTSDFTVPTSRLTAITNTKLLIHSNLGDGGVFFGGPASKTITVTKGPESTFSTNGDEQTLVSGSYSNSEDFHFTVGDASNSGYFEFECDNGKSIVVNGFRWFQSGANGHGNWVFEASNDNFTTTVTLKSTFALGGATEGTYNNDSANTTAYKKFRLRKTSGTTSGVPYLQEFELFNNIFTDSSDGASNQSTAHDITATGAYHSQGHGGITPAMSWPTSKKATGSAGAYFDGSGDYLTIASGPDFNGSAFTYEWWMYPEKVDSNNQVIFDARDGSNSNNHRCYIAVSGSGCKILHYNGSGTLITYDDIEIPLYAWSHIALASDGTDMRCYVNGKYNGVGTKPSTDNGNGVSIIFGNLYSDTGGSTNAFKGYFDQIRIRSGAISTSTNTSNWGNGFSQPTKIYGAYFPTNPSVGTITITGATTDSTDVAFSEINNTLPNGLTLTDGGTSGATDPNGASVSAMTAHITGTLTDYVITDTTTSNIRIQAKANNDDKRITEVSENSNGSGEVSITKKAGGAPVLFNARRYMGTATKPKSINNFGFSPDMLWFKNRDRSHNHRIFDTVQGVVGSNLVPNDNVVQATNNNAVAEYTSDGFRMGDSGDVNIDNEGHIVWGWKAGGAPVSISNTSNATNITQSASSTTGLSITKFTGPSATADVTVTIPHNLDGTPEFIILKSLSNAFSWLVYHKDSATGTSNSASHYSLHLNSSVGRQTNDGSANDSGHIGTPTNSNIVLSPGVGTNHNNYHTGDVIMYAFKPVSGVSKFGTYTGSGGAYNSSTGKGGVTDVGFKPRWIMLKSIDASHPWVIFDSFREETDIKNNYIRANEPDSGADGADFAWEFKSTGFEGTSGNTGTWTNETDKTYIYMAFA